MLNKIIFKLSIIVTLCTAVALFVHYADLDGMFKEEVKQKVEEFKEETKEKIEEKKEEVKEAVEEKKEEVKDKVEEIKDKAKKIKLKDIIK